MQDLVRANESRFVFAIDGTEFQVAEFNARERISTLFEVDLTLVSEEEINFEDAVGKTALLTVFGHDELRFFHGIVNQFIQAGETGRFFKYQARIVPYLWILSLEQDCRIFQQKSVPDIIKEVFQDSGITGDHYDFRLQGTYEPREYCVQYRESDLNFVSRLLEEEGIFYFFEHSEDKHLLIFGDGAVNYMPISGNDDVVYNPGGGMIEEEESVYRFILSHAMCTGKCALRDFYFAKPALNLTSDKEDKENNNHEIYDYPGEYVTENDGKKIAQIRLEEAIKLKNKAEGKSVCPRFSPGFTFNLKEHTTSSFNQTYLLYEVVHNGAQPQVLQENITSTSQEASYKNQFYGIPSTVTFRPDRNTPKPVVEGVQTAIITGPAGEEIYTDKYGRVKVQFHWDRLGKKDEKSSCWIRVSQGWAGAGWGAMFIPRIGHEVIVDFLEGDPDRPIITGRVYHGTNTPPYELPSEMTKSTIKSNSSKGGGGSNEMRFEDKSGEEEIFIHAQKDMNTVVENNRSNQVGSGDSLSVGGSRTVSVSQDESTDIGQNRTENVRGDEQLTVVGSRTKTIQESETLTISGSRSLNVGGNNSLNINEEHRVYSVGQMRLDSRSRVELTSPEISLIADDSIQLQVGNSEIFITRDSIALNTNNLFLHGGRRVLSTAENMQFIADAQNEIRGLPVMINS